MVQMAVDTTVGKQPDQMERGRLFLCVINCTEQCRILEEFSVADCEVDPRNVLIHHTTGTDIHVSDLRVSHLTFRQPNLLTRGVECSPGELLEEIVDERRSRLCNRTDRRVFCDPVPVQHNEDDAV